MPIQDKLKTNPELININNTIADTLDELIDREWGTIVMTFQCQNGRIKMLRVTDEKTFLYKNEVDKE